MTETDPLLRADRALRAFAVRAWAALRRPTVPDYNTPDYDTPDYETSDSKTWALEPPVDLRLRRLDRIRDALEQTRAVVERDGWTSGGWFTVRKPSGRSHTVTSFEALGVRASGAPVISACLVGTLLRLADDPDTATSISDVWGCVDELYEAMHESLGHRASPPGHVFSPADRYSRLRGLTAWNDVPGRTQAQVVDLLDRAVSRTIVGACR